LESKTLPLIKESDIVMARKAAKDLAAALGFGLLEQIQLATAVSELARNAIKYAGGGEITLALVNQGRRRGIELVCRDDGPGIADLNRVLAGGVSTGGGLGRGLSGSRSLLDDFSVDTAAGRGTKITGRKWLA
jgi:serine/threonine-protein kinase RsbT